MKRSSELYTLDEATSNGESKIQYHPIDSTIGLNREAWISQG